MLPRHLIFFPMVFSREETSDDGFKPERQFKKPYSLRDLLKVPRYSIDLIRGNISSNLGDFLVNAILLQLQHIRFLHPIINLKDIIIDELKLNKAKSKSESKRS